jgi:glycosyltransferase involved in cell wall biosynthesis
VKVFGLTTGSDTAGINVAISRAFRRHAPEWDVRSMVATSNYIGYPVDVPFGKLELEALYDAAQVVHLHNTTHAHDWYDNWQGKPTVLMHHGRTGIDFPRWAREAMRIGATSLGSTLDLELLEPGVKWLPPPVYLEGMRRLREEHYRPGYRLRIGHAPTNRAIKGTDAFLAAIGALRASGAPVEAVLIEGLAWQECLARKATCDVFYDQPTLGYGVNAVEAWAMGIPVIAGVADAAIRRGMEQRWGGLPFAETTEASLEVILRAIVKHERIRDELARMGTAHVERWHDERHTVETLKDVYADAKPTTPGGNSKRITKVNRATAMWAVRRASLARLRA